MRTQVHALALGSLVAASARLLCFKDTIDDGEETSQPDEGGSGGEPWI